MDARNFSYFKAAATGNETGFSAIAWLTCEQSPCKPEREGSGDEQHEGRILLAVIMQDAGEAEAQGQRRAKQDGRLYKSRK